MNKRQRLDQALVSRRLVPTRSQGASYVLLGKVAVNGKVTTNPGWQVDEADKITLTATEQYVSRAGLKLEGAAAALDVDFHGKTVLDVGSSTGGFTDYALQHGASQVIAVDAGTNQLHASLRRHPRIELHEKTDIRDFKPAVVPDVVVIDVSFISLKEILPHIAKLAGRDTVVVAMAKPQFEADQQQLSGGVVKNDRMRRDILKSFEAWVRQRFVVEGKADSEVPGAKGNRERFYVLKKLGTTR